MADINLALEIETTWKQMNDIHDIFMTSIYDSTEERDITLCDDFKTDVSPLVLSKPNNSVDSCVLSFKSYPGHRLTIKGFDLLCSTRTVEIYHNTDGYLFSKSGQSVDHTEPLYRCSFLPFSTEIQCDDIYLKFPVKDDIEEIRLYMLKLYITVDTTDITEGAGTQIDLEKVKSYLGTIPDSAKGLFQNIETYQRSQQSMKAAMLTGSTGNMGSFGMMGLMSALMGGFKMSPSVNLPTKGISTNKVVNIVNGSNNDSKSKNEEIKTESQIFNNETSHYPAELTADGDLTNKVPRNSNQEIVTKSKLSNDESACNTKIDPTNEDDNLHKTMSRNNVLDNLLNSTKAVGGDDMFSMLKDICSKVSHQRTSTAKDVVTDSQQKHVEEEGSACMVTETNDSRDAMEEQLQKTEERLKLYIDKQISDLEERLNQKLDRILNCLTHSYHTKPP